MNQTPRQRKLATQSTSDWLISLLEEPPNPYSDFEDRHDPAKNKTGVDFEYNKQQELKHFAGKATRVDLVVLPDGCEVKRVWLAGWMPRDKAAEAKQLEPGWTIASAANLLEAQGWTVRRWHNAQGKLEARAFRCGLRCVRTAGFRRRWEERRTTETLVTTGLDSRFDG